MARRMLRVVAGWGCALSLVSSVGCGDKSQPPVNEARSRLQQLYILLAKFAAKHGGDAPADEAALRAFLADLPPHERSHAHVTDPDALFVSPRDQQPFVVRYGGRMPPFPGEQATAEHVVAYERSGAQGKKLVVYGNGQIEEVDEARARELHLK